MKQVRYGRLCIPAVHGLQNTVIAVLNGDIQIGQDLRFPGNGVNQFLRHLVGVEVVQAYPVEIQTAQLPEKFCKLMFTVQVRAVAGDILGNHQQFLYARRRQFRRLIQQFLHGTAPVAAP